jgi:hypothetical protein
LGSDHPSSGVNQSNTALEMLQSANAGSGDRADPSQWAKIEGPVKVFFCTFSVYHTESYECVVKSVPMSFRLGLTRIGLFN